MINAPGCCSLSFKSNKNNNGSRSSVHRMDTTAGRSAHAANSDHDATNNDNVATSLPKRIVQVQFVPSCLILEQVCLQYPVTLARRLFSSVPRREFAVHNVSCQFGCSGGEIVLLQGASSSGKSALFKVLTGQETATSGSVRISTLPDDEIAMAVAKPIMLVDKPEFDNQNSAQDLLEQEATKAIQSSLSQPQKENDKELEHAILIKILQDVCRWTNLREPASSLMTQQTPAQLSPSENYRLRLAIAALQSSLPAMELLPTPFSTATASTTTTAGVVVVKLPAPILFLDEWMDFETRDSSAKVEEALLQLVQATGGIVICATHKPNLWKGFTATNLPSSSSSAAAAIATQQEPQESRTVRISQMTMCWGEILSRRQ